MAEGRVQRKLAAIMAADVVGYSRLTEANEEGTRARLMSLHLELIDPRIAADGGRIVKTMGDGILVEFPSAVDAVRNALSIQGAMRRRNADVIGEDKIVFRVGINVGDVIIEGDDIHGDGVNIAARLEGLCEPGGVYVSGTAYDQAEGKLAASFDDLGEQLVKNIAKPVRVYRANDEANLESSTVSPTEEASLPSEKPSVAVLPFDNMSNDPDQEYFSDGMSEDLITDISKISGVSVTARNSSFAFKGQAMDVKEIAKKLGVRHIVEGSVRKMGDRLRINAQLIDGNNGQHIWAERYDGDMKDIFQFQDDIREQIVTALQVSLTPTDKLLTERKATVSVEAYDLYLRGRAIYYRFNPEELNNAVSCFEKAIEIDPTFADAYGYLSYCHFQGWVRLIPGFENNFQRAHELAERGVELDSESAVAITYLGWLQLFLHRYDEAIANLEKALVLAPNSAEVYSMFGQALNFWGNPERALEMIEKAFSIDTTVPPHFEFQLGLSKMLLGHHGEAVRRFKKTIERAPKFSQAYVNLACAYVELGRFNEASNTIKTLMEITPQYTIKNFAQRIPFRSDKSLNRFLDNLRKAGMPEE